MVLEDEVDSVGEFTILIWIEFSGMGFMVVSELRARGCCLFVFLRTMFLQEQTWDECEI